MRQTVIIRNVILSFLLGYSLLSCGDDATGVNISIEKVNLVAPEDEMTCSPVALSLEWNFPNVEGSSVEQVSYDIYLGTSLDALEKKETISSGSTTRVELPDLEESTRYYWQVVSSLGDQTSSSDIYAFQTTGKSVVTYPPNEPTNAVPGDGSKVKAGKIKLSWTCTDDDVDDLLEYVVYLGSSPTKMSSQNGSKTSTGGIAEITIDKLGLYYWQVEVRDVTGQTNQSPIWRFEVE